VSRIYNGGRVVALKDISLQIVHGEWLSVVGPSGSGKSTLLHLLGGLDHPTQGIVIFEGRKRIGTKEWARLRGDRIGFVFQAFNLLPTLTALENVEIPMFGRIHGSRRRKHAMELLDRVGLADRNGHRPGKLSGGERQRVAIARALANSPDLILADEPTGNLDSGASEEIMDLLGKIHSSEKTTLIVITHEPGIAARATRTLKLIDGTIASDSQ
jgi:putative ABC transport system ATP-binding protein